MKIIRCMLLLSCLIQAHSTQNMNVFLPQQFYAHCLGGQCFEDDFEWVWDVNYICCRKDNVYGGYKIINGCQQVKLEEFSEESQAKNHWHRLEKWYKINKK